MPSLIKPCSVDLVGFIFVQTKSIMLSVDLKRMSEELPLSMRIYIDKSCVYNKIKDRKVVFLILYVDNILIIGNDVESLTSVKVQIIGKSSVACASSRMLYGRGKLLYVLDGDNVKHGLNSDLSEVTKLFVDTIVICIGSLISPYKTDRDAYRAMVPDGDFVEARDPKGLYKLAHAGKIKVTFKSPCFTGIDDPYEAPLNFEIVLTHDRGVYATPSEMAEEVISYLISSENFLQQTRSSVLHGLNMLSHF
ncbi:hypothetical protein UlMin_010468 [Ulmus minor]